MNADGNSNFGAKMRVVLALALKHLASEPAAANGKE